MHEGDQRLLGPSCSLTHAALERRSVPRHALHPLVHLQADAQAEQANAQAGQARPPEVLPVQVLYNGAGSGNAAQVPGTHARQSPGVHVCARLRACAPAQACPRACVCACS